MKNEIGRKLTSLTIMAIMFAGGMAIGVPSFMPEAASDLSSTDGMLTVSTTTLQGSAILEIVVNDPDVSDTTIDINSGPTVDVGSATLDMSQAVNGKWYVYVVDASAAVLAEAAESGTTNFEYGILCESGLGISENTTDLIITSTTNVYIAGKTGFTGTSIVASGCMDADNAVGTTDDSGSTAREDLTAAVLQNAPALSNHNDATSGQSDIDLGQLGHGLNASGYGSWPYIVSQDLTSDTIVSYGGDSITVEYGDTTDETSIVLTNQNPADSTNVHITITDPALNIDPTTADTWEFGLGGTATTPLAYFSNNGTATDLTGANLNELDFGDNGIFTADSTSYIVAGGSALTVVSMAETGANTGVFESFDATGAAEFLTIDEAAADSITLFSYGGNTVDMIITYNDATITMDSDGAWEPATTVTISVNDPDANKNPTSTETLAIGDETHVIPTIKMGSPLTLAQSGTNANMKKGATDATTGVKVGCGGGTGCTTSGGGFYTLQITNTTDNSERLRIIHSAETNTHVADLVTWINVTTGHTRATLVGLAGTVVLNYDVTGPCALLTCTAVAVYVTDSGENSTNNAAGLITVNAVGNDQAGVYDLDDDTQFISDVEVHAQDTFSSSLPGEAGTVFVSVDFKLTHAAGNDFDADADYAIAADFCNFDQNNSSLVHNCIYRLEAEETGDNTGIFEGTVEYINLVNSTAASGAGTHAGNANTVAGLLGYVNGDALTVVLQDAVSGSDSVRVVYNDTDSFQVATKIGAQLETSVHTGTIDLDADTYGVSDIGTITIVDADLNQDSSIRDTYTNSSTTFQVTISTTSGSTTTSQKPFSGATITAIETGPSTGVFVATFLIPDFKGADLEVTYYEAKNAASSTVEFYDTATITSNTGSVSFDRSVYPVPWTANDLSDGAGNLSVNTEAGDVTVWITITDIDETGDTMTVGGGAAGAITVTIGTNTCFTAGGLVAYDAVSGTTAAESGPLSEVVIGSSVYETSITVSEETDCAGDSTRDVVSGDVMQVKYVDQADDSGVSSNQFDSSTFDLRTGSLSVDKDVYVLGSDMVVTLTDPDLNLDSSSSESYAMSIIEWDSSANSSQLLSLSYTGNSAAGFSNNPTSIEETGSDTGVFQTVTTIPSLEVVSGGTDIEYGEAVTLTYVDVGLSGENNVGDDTLDVEAYFSISNFGALIELDKAVYNWTDTVYVTITAPDHNTNSAAEETIGTSNLPIQASTRNGKMCTTASSKYFIGAETGPDTGIFTSEIGLTGYSLTTAANFPTPATVCSQSDSTANTIATKGQTDGISVSYEYTDAVVVVASASIMFSIGEASFDTSSASAGGSAVLTFTDADANTNGDVIQSISADIFSDSDNGGLSLTLTETDEDTGVFEGTVFFTTDAATSGSNLRVSEGDTVTAEVTDATLPEPYTDSDDLTLAATLTIGTAFPPLERAPAANARVVDAFGASVAEVTVDQQVQIAADVSNGQSKDQAFAYLVQVQDENGVTVSLAWITGSLTAGQSMSPALSWTPSASGSYTATVFVWESVDNPTALSPTTSVTIDVV